MCKMEKLTAKLDGRFFADDSAVHVGGRTGVFAYMFAFNWVADNQVALN